MTNRVLLNTNGLKVSAPGKDVLTALKNELQFSSDWGSLRPYMTGQASPPRGSTFTVNFGKTFTNSIPLVSVFLYGSVYGPEFGGAFYTLGYGGPSFAGYSITRSSFTLILDSQQDYLIQYVVWNFSQ